MKFIYQLNPVVRHVTFLYHLKIWKCNVGKKWVKTTDSLTLKAAVWFALRIYWVVSILMQIGLQYYIYSHTKMSSEETRQTSTMELFPKVVDGFQPLTVFANSFILTFWQSSEYASGIQKQPPEVFCKHKILRNFAKFTGKYLVRTPFLQNTSRRLLLIFLKLFNRALYPAYYTTTFWPEPFDENRDLDSC